MKKFFKEPLLEDENVIKYVFIFSALGFTYIILT